MLRCLAVLLVLLMCCGGPAQAQGAWPFSWFDPPAKARKQPSRGSSIAPTEGQARTGSIVRPAHPNRATFDPNQAAKASTAANAGPAPTAAQQWRVLRTEWTARDEKEFEEFVRSIGESNCRTMHACLTVAEANPLYHSSNPPGMHFYADCADLPYMLRAYFAWKKGLPFSYSTAVTPLGQSSDIRYTARGNHVASRRDLVGPVIDVRRAIPQIVDTISSAHYRSPPNDHGQMLPDHYPVRITRDSIKPGTTIYDPNGHVAVVYKVSPEGRIHYIDTHPDNSLTRGVYGRAFVRASPAMGAGFKRWRPLTLVNARRLDDGSYVGGQIVLAHNKDIADWSDEQFYGTEGKRPLQWQLGKFAHNGETVDYYDFVRKRLGTAGFKYNPVDEVRSMVRALCEDIKYRIDAVDVAIKAGIHRRQQPDRLPVNIYGTDGDWETYSTPSRDARLKTSFKELRDEAARFVMLAKAGSQALAYSGDDLAGDLAGAYRSQANDCRVSYVQSNGATKELSFDDVANRLFLMSFDPHHCVERRWGAIDPAELSSCEDGTAKRTWYTAQQRLRNQIDRTYDVRMNFALGDLQRAVAGSGVDQAPDIAVLRLFGTPVAATATPDLGTEAALAIPPAPHSPHSE